MGKKKSEELDVTLEELRQYLYANHSVYMQVGDITYYITDDYGSYWRAQDTNNLNEKGHFIDTSELVPTLAEFLELPFIDDKSITDVFDEATFYANEDFEA